MDVGLLLHLRELQQRRVVELERRLHRAMHAQLERAHVAVAFVAAHRLEVLDRALPRRQPRAPVGPLGGAGLAAEIVGGDAHQGAAGGHERGAHRGGLEEGAAIPRTREVGMAIEIGSVIRSVGHGGLLQRHGEA